GRNEAERRGVLSARKGRTGPHPRQPLVERITDPGTQKADAVRAHLAVDGIGAVRDTSIGAGVRIPRISVRAVIALVADRIVVGLEAPHPLVDLKVVAEIHTADEIAIVGAVAIVKGVGKGGITAARDGRSRLPALAGMIPRAAD